MNMKCGANHATVDWHNAPTPPARSAPRWQPTLIVPFIISMQLLRLSHARVTTKHTSVHLCALIKNCAICYNIDSIFPLPPTPPPRRVWSCKFKSSRLAAWGRLFPWATGSKVTLHWSNLRLMRNKLASIYRCHSESHQKPRRR